MIMGQASAAQIVRTTNFEGSIPHWYQDWVHVWTGGVGHTEPDAAVRASFPAPFSRDVVLGWLAHDMMKCDRHADAFEAAHPGFAFTPEERDAYDDAMFNCGIGLLDGAIGKNLAAGNRQAAADALMAWCHAPAGVVSQVLLARRHAERELILRGVHPVEIVSTTGVRPIPPTEEVENEAIDAMDRFRLENPDAIGVGLVHGADTPEQPAGSPLTNELARFFKLAHLIR